MTLPDDDIHDEAVADEADDKHHGVDCSDDGDDGRHAPRLPAIIVGHIAALGGSGHPSWGIDVTVLQRCREALRVFFENFDRSAFHCDTCVWGCFRVDKWERDCMAFSSVGKRILAWLSHKMREEQRIISDNNNLKNTYMLSMYNHGIGKCVIHFHLASGATCASWNTLSI